MRKKGLLLVLSMLFLVWTAGCAGTAPESNDSASKESASKERASEVSASKESSVSGESAASADVDIDLTALSSTMVYAEVYNITTNPDDYVGKTIRMRGPYRTSFYDMTGLNYHYVLIEDAAACCQQGIEFKLPGDLVYPQDYPSVDEEIEVAGVFGSYDELEYTYYYLEVDEMSVIEG